MHILCVSKQARFSITNSYLDEEEEEEKEEKEEQEEEEEEEEEEKQEEKEEEEKEEEEEEKEEEDEEEEEGRRKGGGGGKRGKKEGREAGGIRRKEEEGYRRMGGMVTHFVRNGGVHNGRVRHEVYVRCSTNQSVAIAYVHPVSGCPLISMRERRGDWSNSVRIPRDVLLLLLLVQIAVGNAESRLFWNTENMHSI